MTRRGMSQPDDDGNRQRHASRRRLIAGGAVAALGFLVSDAVPGHAQAMGAASPPPHPTPHKAPLKDTHYRTLNVDGIDIFYREAGPTEAPTIVMLHGYPTSSRMYRRLIPMLSDRYHVIAPDYPAFGQSAVPPRGSFSYTHEHLSEVMDGLMTRLGIGRFGLYLMDFGGPIGYRIMLKRQANFAGVVLQNTPAFGEETSPETWGPLLAYWKTGSEAARDAARFNLGEKTIKGQYLTGVRDPSLIDPEGWTIDSMLIARPDVGDIMMDLLYDIRNNKQAIADARAFLKAHQRQAMIATGVNDPLFPGSSMTPPADMAGIEFHGVDSGHFALEDKWQEIGGYTRAFFDRVFSA